MPQWVHWLAPVQPSLIMVRPHPHFVTYHVSKYINSQAEKARNLISALMISMKEACMMAVKGCSTKYQDLVMISWDQSLFKPQHRILWGIIQSYFMLINGLAQNGSNFMISGMESLQSWVKTLIYIGKNIHCEKTIISQNWFRIIAGRSNSILIQLQHINQS